MFIIVLSVILRLCLIIENIISIALLFLSDSEFINSGRCIMNDHKEQDLVNVVF
jgi:hypothetical protein